MKPEIWNCLCPAAGETEKPIRLLAEYARTKRRQSSSETTVIGGYCYVMQLNVLFVKGTAILFKIFVFPSKIKPTWTKGLK